MVEARGGLTEVEDEVKEGVDQLPAFLESRPDCLDTKRAWRRLVRRKAIERRNRMRVHIVGSCRQGNAWSLLLQNEPRD